MKSVYFMFLTDLTHTNTLKSVPPVAPERAKCWTMRRSVTLHMYYGDKTHCNIQFGCVWVCVCVRVYIHAHIPVQQSGGIKELHNA